MHEQHARKPPKLRNKLERAALENAALMSQLLVSCHREVLDQHALTAEASANIFTPFLEGNVNLDLQAALSELKPGFKPADLTPFKDAIADALATREGRLTSIGQGPKISPGQLEKQAFDLILAGLQHDLDTYQVWRAKCMDREAAIYFQKLQHASTRHARAREIAGDIFAEESTGTSWHMALTTWGKDQVNINKLEQMKDQIAKRQQLHTRDHVRCVAVLNWAAPAVFASSTQHRQAGLLGATVNDESKSIGLVLTPAHFYKKGHLFKAEESAMALLADAGINTDHRFVLAFAKRQDDRSNRSLVQQGVVVLNGTDHKTQDVVYNVWKNVPLLQKNLVSDVAMMATASLLTIEDMAENALPPNTDPSFQSHGQTEKFAQCGQDAASKLLTAMLSNGLNESERTAILVLDLSSRTLEFAKATYELGRSGAAPGAVYYLGFAESAAEEEWQRYHLGSWMANGFLEGTLKLPAGSQPLGPAELPPELVTGLPPKPDLTTLTWSNRKKDGLVTPKTPDKVLQAWHDHAEFGENFRNWLTKAREATALDLSAEEADGKEKPRGSRGGEGTGPAPDPSPTGEPDPKKLKLSTASLPSCFIADVPTPLSWSAQVGVTGGGKKASVRLLIAVGQRIFLCNDSAADITMGAGTILAGYFRGKWLTEKQVAAEPSASDVPFKLVDTNSWVVEDGKLLTLGHCVQQRRAKSPLEVKIRYHEIKERPTGADAKFFQCDAKQVISFRPESAPVKEQPREGESAVVNSSALAGVVNPDIWTTATSEVVFAMKWGAHGFTPAGPWCAS